MIRRSVCLLAVSVSIAVSSSVAAQGLVDRAIGATCEADEDCLEGLFCLTALATDLGGRAPARGLCTTGCTMDSDCWPYNPPNGGSALCETVEGVSLCLEECAVGQLYSGESKCHGREDAACRDAGRGEELPSGVCVPTCTSDAQCGTRYCNPALGLCQDEAVAGDPVGASCDPYANEPTCAGICDTSGNQDESGGAAGASTIGVCSKLCVVGGPIGCGWSGEGPPRVSCDAVGLVAGDRGHCSQLCDCNADCLASTQVCEPGVRRYGTAGKCVPAATASGDIPECQGKTDLGRCIYGDLKACKGEGSCLGSAQCLDDKTGYGECQCGDTGSAAGGQGAGGAGLTVDGVGSGDVEQSEQSGQTPESGCSCSWIPAHRASGWVALLLTIGGVVLLRAPLRRHGRALPPARG